MAIKLRKDKFDFIFPQSCVSNRKIFFLVLAIRKSIVSVLSSLFRVLIYEYNKSEKIHKLYQNIKRVDLIVGDKARFLSAAYPVIKFSPITKRNVSSIFDNETHPRKIIILGPGSFKMEQHKRWPAINYCLLVENYLIKLKYDVDIIIIGSEDEFGLGQSILSYCDKKNISNISSCMGKLSIIDSIYLISISNVVISNCNAVSHMAALVNVPVVGIYGPTDYNYTGPVLNELYPVSSALSCSPCYSSNNTTGCENPTCMSDVSPKDVFNAIERAITN
jgi:heptosyltransferase-2